MSGLSEKLLNKTSESSETSVSDDVHDFFSSKLPSWLECSFSKTLCSIFGEKQNLCFFEGAEIYKIKIKTNASQLFTAYTRLKINKLLLYLSTNDIPWTSFLKRTYI